MYLSVPQYPIESPEHTFCDCFKNYGEKKRVHPYKLLPYLSIDQGKFRENTFFSASFCILENLKIE